MQEKRKNKTKTGCLSGNNKRPPSSSRCRGLSSPKPSASFDTVDHTILIERLKLSPGVSPGQRKSFRRPFLSNRTCSVEQEILRLPAADRMRGSSEPVTRPRRFSGFMHFFGFAGISCRGYCRINKIPADRGLYCERPFCDT